MGKDKKQSSSSSVFTMMGLAAATLIGTGIGLLASKVVDEVNKSSISNSKIKNK